MQGRKLVSVLLVGALVFGMTLQVHAATIDEAKKKEEELQTQKNAAEAEKANLSTQLTQVLAEMQQTQQDIEKKQGEIEKKEEELMQAKLVENNQYESMKMRIKYMYENGNTQFVEILCEAKSIGDFLNKADYITQLSEYDRNMLVEFQKVVKDVEAQEAALQEEGKKLEELRASLIEKQNAVQVMLETKSGEINTLEAEIGANAQLIAQLEEQAAQVRRQQEEAAAAAASKKNTGVSSGGNAGAPVVSGNGQLAHPCPSGYISSHFGGRTSPTAGASSNHRGIDIAASSGSPIYAADSGKVVTASYSSVRGNYVIIDHANGLSTLYQHCSSLYVSVGQTVSRGQNIAAVGSTGVSTGPHLHFEVWSGQTEVNPENYI